ncbi:hypothetical protein KUTeg_016113 [Tegillarca granosa]|uniref:Uncharacterized protein n=1 Tax=Tegillarca granosa TaxID=220873 RepID=A0ABQ9EJX5_TEGGR|nr:hypothetical protein KUTeg_016113 [Tegillarca granosa]
MYDAADKEVEVAFTDDVMSNIDRHTEYIELSNKCREFYKKRIESADTIKQRLSPTPTADRLRKKNSLDIIINNGKNWEKSVRLYSLDFSSLMDQDLSLMKQLLTLNESIEELKFKRRYSCESVPQDSQESLNGSDWSVSETDIFNSDDDLYEKCKNPSMRSLSSRLNLNEDIENMNYKMESSLSLSKQHTKLNSSCSNLKFENPDILINGHSLCLDDEEQSAYDSGVDSGLDSSYNDIAVLAK